MFSEGTDHYIEIVQFSFTMSGHFIESARHAPMKKVNACEDGGFRKLKAKLLSGDPIKCRACEDLLTMTGFSHQCLETEVLQFLGSPQSQPSQQSAEDSALQREQDDKTSGNGECENEGDDADAGEKKEVETEGPPDPFHYAKQHEPIITLLPPGHFGKSYPYRCNIRKSKTQPQGKIGNLNVAKAKSVRFFLDQRLDCATHKRNYKRYMDEKNGCATPASRGILMQCEALSVNDPQCAGSLHARKQEFWYVGIA